MIKTKVRVAAAVVSSLGALLAGAAAPAVASSRAVPNDEPGASVTLRLQNAHSGKCLGISGSSIDNYAAVVQLPCTTNTAQRWTLTYLSNVGDVAILKNYHSQKCLAINGSSTAGGAAAVQYTCNGITNQAWHAPNTDLPVINYHSNLCLTVAGASTADFAPAVQSTCNGKSEQTWVFLGEA
jgi:hypothetical protein